MCRTTLSLNLEQERKLQKLDCLLLCSPLEEVYKSDRAIVHWLKKKKKKEKAIFQKCKQRETNC